MKPDFPQRLMKNWAVKILSLAAAILIYFLTGISELEERYITVQLDYSVPEGYALFSGSASRVPVTLRGDSDGLWDISEADIVLSADFRDIQDEGVFRRPVNVTRRGAALSVDSLEVIPETSFVDAEIQHFALKRVSVRVPNSGTPAHGYELSRLTVTPPEIAVGGPRSLVEALEELLTPELSLEGRRGDFVERSSPLLPDPRLSKMDNQSVEIRGNIAEIVRVEVFRAVDVIVFDLADGLFLEQDLERGELQVQAPLLLLEDLDPRILNLSVDAGDLAGPGNYSLPVRPIVPAGILVLQYSPTELEIEIGLREEEE